MTVSTPVSIFLLTMQLETNMQSASPAAAAARFIKVSAAGLLLAPDATDWVAVYQPERELTWSRDVMPGATRTWKAAVKAAQACELCGWSGAWQAPSRLDYAHLIDDQLHGPAIDAAFFTVQDKYQWEWTGTECSPPGYAWGVDLYYGFSDRDSQSYHFHVRAVRAGQVSGPLGQVST